MKIAHVLAWVSRMAGGLFHSVSGLAVAQKEMPGLEVAVFGVEDVWSGQDRAQWRSVSVQRSYPVGPSRLCFSPGMQRRIEEFSPDIMHSAAVWTYPAAIVNRIHAAQGIPYVLSTRGALDSWARNRSKGKKWLAARLFQKQHFDHAACIHALCESEARSIRAYGLKNPVCVIPNGVDLPGDFRQLAGGGQKTLLFLGRIHVKKGLVPLIQAWGGLKAGLKDWRLVIAGPDENGHLAEVRQCVAESGVEDTVEFVGPQYGVEKDQWLRRADAFILPSFSEGLPMAVLEAWAYAKPVLMTPECNLPEGFEAGAALRIEANATSIAEGLRTLMGLSNQERTMMGVRGRALVEARFTWPRIAQQMKTVYDWVLGGGPVPDSVTLK